MTFPAALLCPLLTVSSKTNAVPSSGAVKVTIGADALLSDTSVPAVCFQEKVIVVLHHHVTMQHPAIHGPRLGQQLEPTPAVSIIFIDRPATDAAVGHVIPGPGPIDS